MSRITFQDEHPDPNPDTQAFIAYANIKGINLKDDAEWRPIWNAQCRRQNVRPTEAERDRSNDD